MGDVLEDFAAGIGTASVPVASTLSVSRPIGSGACSRLGETTACRGVEASQKPTAAGERHAPVDDRHGRARCPRWSLMRCSPKAGPVRLPLPSWSDSASPSARGMSGPGSARVRPP